MTSSIFHCPEGVRLNFTCPAFDPNKAITIPGSKNDYYCCNSQVCCIRDRQHHERRLEDAKQRLGEVKKTGETEAVSAAKQEVELASHELRQVGVRHLGCVAKRTKV